MNLISPYLIFQGNCEEAINFYQQCLGGEVSVRRFGETEMPLKQNIKMYPLAAVIYIVILLSF